MVLELEASSLQHLCFELHIPATAKAREILESVASSAVLRWGPSLTTLSVSTPLSDVAVQHIMRLPKLTMWKAWNAPPRISDSSLSESSLRLETLDLHVKESFEWLPLFEATARCTPVGQEKHIVDLAKNSPPWLLGWKFQSMLLSYPLLFYSMGWLTLRSNQLVSVRVGAASV